MHRKTRWQDTTVWISMQMWTPLASSVISRMGILMVIKPNQGREIKFVTDTNTRRLFVAGFVAFQGGQTS